MDQPQQQIRRNQLLRNDLPKGVQFQNIPPMGFQQEFRDYVVTPQQTFSQTFSQNDVVRIQFNMKDWYIDPYESFIEAEVKLTDETSFGCTSNGATGVPISSTTSPNQLPRFYMMDGPSTSLISDYRLIVNSNEIERIREYDQLGSILADLNVYPDAVDQKDIEGYYSIQGKKTIQQPFVTNKFLNQSVATSTTLFLESSITTNNPLFTNQSQQQSDGRIKTIVPGVTSSQYWGNPGLAVNAGVGGSNIISSAGQILKELAAYPPGTVPSYVPTVRANTDPVLDIYRGSAAGNPYGTLGQVLGESTLMGQMTIHNSNYGIFGDKSIETWGNNPCQFSPKLDQIDGHNIFLTNMPISKIINGVPVNSVSDFYNQSQNAKYTATRAYMQIPLLSGVMGVLIPQDRWQLIPSQSLGMAQMEFRFNKDAFISHDGNTPQWQVTKFQLKLRMYRFDDQLQNQLRQTVSNGIQLHSQIFSMGPMYSIQPGVSVTNNWQLNNGIPSLKQLFFWFLADDYQQRFYCRKNFRLSHNITSMQLKLGSQFIPQLPITGHAGNIVMNSVIKQDNSVFLSELQAGLNILFDCKKHININKLNFSINERPYDVTGVSYNGLYCSDYVTGSNTILASQQIQQLRLYGYYFFQEMRCRGKALYAFNLEMDKKNDETITGVNTTSLRPIELILRSDEPTIYPRNSTMYVMYLSDFIVSFNGTDTTCEGQG